MCLYGQSQVENQNNYLGKLWKEEREEEGNKITSNAPFVPGAELGTSINIEREL